MINFMILLTIYVFCTVYLNKLLGFFGLNEKIIVKYILIFCFNCTLFIFYDWEFTLIVLLVTYVSHFIFILIKKAIKGYKKDENSLFKKCDFFILIMNNLFIIFAYYILSTIIFEDEVARFISSIDHLIKYITAILLLISPSSILIEKFINLIEENTKSVNVNNNTVTSGNSIEENTKSVNVNNDTVTSGNSIGIAERLLIFVLLFFSASSFLSIAAVLTAKTWARTGDLNNNPIFRLKYLAGTFLSFLLVLLIYGILFNN